VRQQKRQIKRTCITYTRMLHPLYETLTDIVIMNDDEISSMTIHTTTPPVHGRIHESI
jgi:hypothetical protein